MSSFPSKRTLKSWSLDQLIRYEFFRVEDPGLISSTTDVLVLIEEKYGVSSKRGEFMLRDIRKRGLFLIARTESRTVRLCYR